MPDVQQEIGQPKQTANVSAMGIASTQTRQIIQAVIADVQKDRNSDTWRYLGVYGLGFIILAGMFLYGYNRLSDKIDPLDRSVTRIEQKLDDMRPVPPRRP